MLGTIIGIDPGSTMLGVGVLYVDLDTYVIQSTTAFTLDGSKERHYGWLKQYHPDKTVRLLNLEEQLFDIYRHYQPFLIASESPFYNRFRPNAYGVLVETLSIIRQSVYRYNPFLVLRTIDPPSVKKALGASGKDKKDGVAKALAKLTSLNVHPPVAQLDEHSVDAIGVAYAAYKQWLRALHTHSTL